MPRPALWSAIRDTLKDEIAGGRYGPGDKLPTEAVLASRFGVNRHTIRRALADLAQAELVLSRRGAGVFVAQTPTDYAIGSRVRFHRNLRAAGRMPAKEILSLETRRPDQEEARALGLSGSALVHAYEGLSMADDQPIALFLSVFPATRFAKLPEALHRSRSVTAALAEHGVPDYIRASTRLTATLASPSQAVHLHLPDGAPILRTISLNVDLEGVPVEYGHSWFAGDRVTLTVEPE